MGAGQEGIPSPTNIVPGWIHPGPQAPGVESRHRTGLIVDGPLYPDFPEATNIQEEGV